MRLFFRRSQRTGGVFSSAPIFALDARIELDPDEWQLIQKFRLNKEVLYSSEEAQRHAAATMDALDNSSFRGIGKALLSGARLALSLKCTVESLIKGQHIECKDVGELIAAEAAITEAARTLKGYLEVAVSFDGREELVEI